MVCGRAAAASGPSAATAARPAASGPGATASSTENVLPVPGSLRTSIVPLIAATSDFDSARPSPVPSTPVASAPSRSNGTNSRSSFSAAMPGPVSVTEIRTRSSPARSQPIVTVPRGRLYLTAFDRRLRSTCCRRWRSASTCKRSSTAPTRSVTASTVAVGPTSCMACAMVSRTGTGSSDRLSRPASIRLMSSTSLINPSR